MMDFTGIPGLDINKGYVCSPFAGITKNDVAEDMENSARYCAIFSEIFKCKIVSTQCCLPLLLNNNIPAEKAIAEEFTLKVLETCDALFVIGQNITEDMKMLIERAKELKIPVIETDIITQQVSVEKEGTDGFDRR